MIGKTISHYKILEKLGEGGMGVVYKAEDTKLKRQVALKFLPLELIRSDEWQQRFLREAQAAAALAHPNICTVHEIDETDDKVFIAMEYLEGQSLDKKIESGPLDIDEALNIALRVAEGLKHAHKREIVHRDIKPANIMITEDGQTKIMDFGLAKLSGKTRLTKTATVMGTIAYMSPEQARGDSAIDHRTDVWSLGVLLYEMLTGALPFDAETDTGVIYKIINESPEPIRNNRSDIPEALASIVEKAIQRDPQSRYEDAKELVVDLEAVKAGASAAIETRASSIAVLPFINMSADKEQDYFCEGISEELINALCKLEGLKVASRTSAFQFEGRGYDIKDVGAKLKVGNVLEGSVRKAGKRLRITAQLVSVEDGYHLWSEKYDRDIEDVFAIQDEISLAIVDKLKVELMGDEGAKLARRQTVDPEAYQLYLRGRWFWNKQTEEDLRRAIDYFKQATVIAPDYAPAYAGLADSYILLPFYAPIRSKETFPKARDAALKAVEIDDSLAEAHTSVAKIKGVYEWDWEGSEKSYRRAFELNPGYATAHHFYALLLTYLSRFDKAIEEIERALECDPLSLQINADAGFIFACAGQHDRAIIALEKALELDPASAYTHIMLGYTYSMNSMFEEAMTNYKIVKENSVDPMPAVECAIGCMDAMTGKRDKAQKSLKRLLERSKEEYIQNYLLAFLYFVLGEEDKGFECLQTAVKEKDVFLVHLKNEPFFSMMNVRPDPRFAALLKKMNLDT